MMKYISYIIDPDGDVELLLERPNCQQLILYVPSNGYGEECEDPINESTVALPTLAARYHVFDDLLPPAALGTIIYRSRFIAVAEESVIETPNTPKVRTPLEGEVRMRVTSRHLTMASHYFRSVIQGPWREASSTSSFFGKPLRQVTAFGWDAVALAIVLDIIHGRHGGVPRVVDLKLMTCLATIVDFYGCHEVVKIFSEAWYQNICTGFEDEYSRQTLMWLSVSWVFPNQEPFDRATQTILKHMDGRSQLSTDHLPIPGVLPKIDDKRQELIGKIVTGLHDLLGTLPNSDFLCDWHKYESPTCSSIALGILKRELQRLSSSDRPLVPPFNGYSVMSMIQLANDMPESIAATTEEYDHYHDVSACSVRARMRRFLGDVKAEMNSWTLDLNMNVGGD
ncbi:hypothetical protein FOC4_g10014213 [Fusarium odoratissimum]|uniref:BTB domain-containing protein n=1 Tax=Fusarium oxysporum f. sp. cubense (strain race 4) TaxID=2502994 RepID=N1R6D9_FUSC4|nr:hypothetical protein FOC4_g10014213 [Fusarium odoratissimum]